MRRHSLVLFVICYLLSVIPSPVLAKSITPTPKTASAAANTTAPTPNEVIEKLKQIEALKEKIATKVAQIREKDKTATAGGIKKIEEASLLLTTLKGTDVHVSYSDDTIFSMRTGSENKEISAKTLKENDFIAVFGYRDNATISSKYIYVQTPLSRVIGKIADIDKTNFTLTVKDKEGSRVIDIESSTKMTLITPDKKKQKGGFSKFKIGDIIHVVGKRDKKEGEKINASFVITLPNPGQATTPTISPSISPPASPSAKPKK